MNIAELTNLGGVVSALPVKQEITWTRINAEGEEVSDTFDIYVKLLAYGDYEQLFIEPTKEEDEAEYQSRQARLIHLAVRLGEKQDEQLTYDQAFQLESSLAAQFIKAINRVNGRAKKPSAPTTNSGTN